MNLKNKSTKIFISVVAVLLPIILVACITSGVSSDTYSHEEISYSTTDQHDFNADLFLPTQSLGKRPLVIVIHGGGWDSRAGDMVNLCKHIAASGMIAMNITYRLAPKFHYPIQVNDVKSSVEWVNHNIEKYNIDKNKIYTWGYSAGAHLAFLLGNQKDMALPISGIVVGGIPSYFPTYPKSPLITAFIGATFNDQPKVWEEASPLTKVDMKTPPTFIYHGQNDSLIEVKQAQMLNDKLQEVGVKHQFHMVKGLGHITTYFFSKESEDLGIQFLKNIQ